MREMVDRKNRVFIGGITESVRKDDIEKEFEKFGKLTSVWVAQNPPGFAFVEYERESDADDAVRDMNGASIGSSSSKLRVEHSRGRSSRGGGRGGSRGGSRDGGGFSRDRSFGGGGGRGGGRDFGGGSRGGGGGFRGGRGGSFGGRGGPYGDRRGGGGGGSRFGDRGGDRFGSGGSSRGGRDSYGSSGGHSDYKSSGGSYPTYRSRSPLGQGRSSGQSFRTRDYSPSGGGNSYSSGGNSYMSGGNSGY